MKKHVLSCLLSVTALAGCMESSNPKGIVEIASNALAKNDRAEFRASLVGPALEKYASDAAIDGLIARLQTYKDISIAEPVQVDSQDVSRKYRVPIMGVDSNGVSQKVFDVQVGCIDTTEYIPPTRSCVTLEDAEVNFEALELSGHGGGGGGGDHGGGGHSGGGGGGDHGGGGHTGGGSGGHTGGGSGGHTGGGNGGHTGGGDGGHGGGDHDGGHRPHPERPYPYPYPCTWTPGGTQTDTTCRIEAL